MESINVWLIVAYLGGVVVSILWPYLLAYIETGVPFDWRQNLGRVLSALLAALPLFANPEWLEALGALSYVAAFVLGMGASQVGRLAQKTPAPVSKMLR